MMEFCRGKLHQVACDKWPMVTSEMQQKMARMAAAAAWGLGTIVVHTPYLASKHMQDCLPYRVL